MVLMTSSVHLNTARSSPAEDVPKTLARLGIWLVEIPGVTEVMSTIWFIATAQ